MLIENADLRSSDPPSKARKSQFVVPFGRDDSFINRIEIFNHMNNYINKHSKHHHRLALSGIGGVGSVFFASNSPKLRSTAKVFHRKSQVAIEYCYRYRDDNPHAHIFWVHASTKERFDQAYRDIARRLELTGWNNSNVDTLRLVCDWFSEAEDETWLMVLDNADNLDLFFTRPDAAAIDEQYSPPLVDYLPQNSNGLMLITTRDERMAKRLAGIHASVVVNPMSPSEAQELLENRQINLAGSSDDGQSTRLLEALGYIPLAITQAAAFINENQISLTKYLEMFRERDSDLQDLLDEDLGDLRRDSQSQNSVIKTWKISFDLISEQMPRAAEILSLMAVLDRQGIPESLLRDGSDRITYFTKALGTLLAFSLIKSGGDVVGYEMHRLVQLATQKWLEVQGTIEKWREKALVVVADMFPSGEIKTWTTCESLLPHAQKVLENEVTNEVYQVKLSNLLYNVAFFELEQGRYATACVRYLAAVEVQKRSLGLEHPSTLTSMHNLALTYQRQGQLEKAEKLLLEVLEARRRPLGAEHPDTLASMNNLALTYREQGRWEEAEKMQLEVSEATKRMLGAEHPDTLTSTNNLALIYREQGRWEEAEKMQLEVSEATKRMLGAEHPDTLPSTNNLALIYKDQCRWEEAEKLQLEVLEATKRLLGAAHPDTLTSIHNLATTYREQGRLEEAEKMQLEVLEATKRLLGAAHPDTLTSMHNLAIIYCEQGRLEEAEKMQLEVLEARKRLLGAAHPDTLTSMHNLAIIYCEQGRLEEAEKIQLEVLEATKRLLGAAHPDTLTNMHNLAITYREQGRFEDAEELHMQELKICKRVLGTEHPETLISMDNLAILYSKQDRHNEAISLMESVVELRTKVLGANHPHTINSAAGLKKLLGT